MDFAPLPKIAYADVAPLPIPLAQHLYHYWMSKIALNSDDLSEFLLLIKETRHYVYLYMDSFVRNRDRGQSPHRLRYSTQWLRETLAQYTPNKTEIPSKTFNHWVRSGFIRNTKKGQPTPDSGAALCIMRMIIEGTKVLPHSMSADEPAWWCYAQETRESAIRCIPITEIELLSSPSVVLWTPYSGAAWNRHWKLISDAPRGKYFGAIRFKQAETIHGQTYYNVTQNDILSWIPEFASLFKNRALKEEELQAIAHLALVYLAEQRISRY